MARLRLLILATLACALATTAQARPYPPKDADFILVGPCIYDGLGEANRKALLDAYRTGGRRAYAAQRSTIADRFTIAQRCDRNIQVHPDENALLLNCYVEEQISLAVLNEFGVTKEKLDSINGPDTAGIMAEFHDDALVTYTGNESDRTQPIDDSLGPLNVLVGKFKLPRKRRDIATQALMSYYICREGLSILDAAMAP